MSRAIGWVIASLLVVGCAAAPKPRELEAFEQLKRQPIAEAAAKRAPKLVADSKQLFDRAEQEWQSKDLEESRRDALLGGIQLKTAIALVQQDQAKDRIARADQAYRKSEEEYGQVAKDLATMTDAITLLQKLAEAKESAAADKAKMAAQLVAEQQKAQAEQAKADAQQKLAAAELALKTADTMNAADNAKAEYTAASDLLTRARGELQSGNAQAAGLSAELAKSKAEQAQTVAKPIYDQTEQNKQNKTRDEALGRDAAALSGVTVRLERRGDLQRLVLPLRDLFAKKQTIIAPTATAVLDAVAALLKKYPTYPVQVVGHTDNHGKHDELVAVSMARALAVDAALLQRGIDPKRMVVSGSGPDEPVTDNKSVAGRAQNNRVEIVFLYQ
jgi:outer membrane protein OmpA-like peptidoglycan-associated protein